ncbi:MAG TPA: DnaJ domain-containing protein [Planktothrix sp.]
MVRKTTAASNFYQLLGVQPEVTTTEIKKAYRQLAKSHHPDTQYHNKTARQRDAANQYMAQLNEAYETLIDKRRRAEYDTKIGANGQNRGLKGKGPTVTIDEGEMRERYLRQQFNPARAAISKVLGKYKQKLSDLSQDIYDEELVMAFAVYVDEVENVLRQAANDLSSREVPRSLKAGVQMMRYSIAQAVDGLEELRFFCQNYDYAQLHMAGNLFREALDLSRKAAQLTKQ